MSAFNAFLQLHLRECRLGPESVVIMLFAFNMVFAFFAVFDIESFNSNLLHYSDTKHVLLKRQQVGRHRVLLKQHPVTLLPDGRLSTLLDQGEV